MNRRCQFVAKVNNAVCFCRPATEHKSPDDAGKQRVLQCDYLGQK